MLLSVRPTPPSPAVFHKSVLNVCVSMAALQIDSSVSMVTSLCFIHSVADGLWEFSHLFQSSHLQNNTTHRVIRKNLHDLRQWSPNLECRSISKNLFVSVPLV